MVFLEPCRLRAMRLAVGLLLGAAITQVTAQDNLHLHGSIAGHVYKDDKILVRVPENWTVAIDVFDDGNGTFRGAILRRGKYILRLCTGCGQASGVNGGRFSEIAGLVQPWFRVDQLAGSCGAEARSQVTEQLDRIDFWFTRDPHHEYNEDANDCRELKTTDTVWYGSYFQERCRNASPGEDCGGYFLHRDRLLHKRQVGLDEMVFALTYDTTDLDKLPRKGDPEVAQVLSEATGIVKSIHFKGG